jgi:protein-tyrosine-phosphatase
MILNNLSFGTFQEIEPNIVEIIVDEGIELSDRHIEQIETGLLEKYDNSYALLINRLNSYSHTHASMQKVARLKRLVAIAIVVYSDISEQVAKIHQVLQDNVRIYQDRDSAIVWLKETINKASKNC